MVEMEYYFIILIPFLITMLLMPVGTALLRYLDIIDHPDQRKKHKRPIPATGGIIFFITFLISVFVFLEPTLTLITYTAGVSFLVVVGFIDDIRSISPYNKFFAQLLAAFLFVSITRYHLQIEFLSGYPSLLFILTVLYIVAITNAVNFIDGLDGLAAGLIIIGFTALSFFLIGNPYLILSLILISTLFGFLRANTFPAMIFMGDSGSYFLGYSFAVVSLIAIGESQIPFWLPLLLLGVPIFDMVHVFYKRLRLRKNIFMPDRNHVHFRLHARGISHKNTVFLLYSIQAVISLTAIGLYLSFDRWLIVTLIILVLLTLQHIILVSWQDLKWTKFTISESYTDIFRKYPIFKNAYVYYFFAILIFIGMYQIFNAPVVGHTGIIMVFVGMVTAYLFILDKNAGRSANVSIGMILLAGLGIIINQLGTNYNVISNGELLLWFGLMAGIFLSIPGMFKQHHIFDSPTEFLLIILLLLSTLHGTIVHFKFTGYFILILFMVYKILLQNEMVRKYNLIYLINIITLCAIIIRSLS